MFGETQFLPAGSKNAEPELDTHGAQRRSTGCRVCRVVVHTGHTDHSTSYEDCVASAPLASTPVIQTYS